MKTRILILIVLMELLVFGEAKAQTVTRTRPVEWNGLVFGGRFMDRFLPMPVQGKLTSDTWGADNVKPRYVDNGLEDSEWSYWGGKALLGGDGKYHLYVCRWREDSARGHHEWPRSVVVHAVAETSTGPYKVKNTVGPGHNPEVFQLKDGRYVIYVMGGYYISDGLTGPWQAKKFEFDPRGRRIIEGLSNLTFARREDGSVLMIGADTARIRVKIAAEKNFDPLTEVDVDSLRFGAAEEVNFGRGCKVAKIEQAGKDLVIVFDGAGNGLTSDNFAGKLLGKARSGRLLFGYARLPGVDYLQPALSPMPPKVIAQKGGVKITVEVQNFGQVSSVSTPLRIVQTDPGKDIEVAVGLIAPLAPFEKTVVDMECATPLANVKSSTIRVIINPKGQSPVTISRRLPRQM